MRRNPVNTTQAKSWIAVGTLLLAAAASQAQTKPTEPVKSTAEKKTAARRIVVSIPDRKLALVENGRVVKVYPVAVGAPANPSPTGEFKIVTRIPDPTYYAPGKVIEPGPDNPLGTRWIGLSLKSFGIHGTNEPRSIGRRASHGCIRMRKHDVEDLFERVREGDAVELRAERTAEMAQIFGAPAAPVAAPAAKPTAQPGLVVVATVVGNL